MTGRWVGARGGALLVLAAAAAVAVRAGISSPRGLAVTLGASYFALWIAALLLSGSQRRETVGRLALSTLGMALAWGMLEVPALLGLVDYRVLFRVPAVQWWFGPPYHVPDRELLHIHPPHLRLAGTQPGDIAALWCLPSATYAYNVQYDRHGFRNTVDLDAAEIAFVGDSFVEAATIPVDLTMPALVARLTGQTVANLGMSAYGPQQELAVLRRYALQLRPRVIVWTIYEGNDLRDLRRYDQATAALQRDGVQPRSSRLGRSFGSNALWALSRILSPCRPDPDLERRRSGVLDTAGGRGIRMYFLHRSEPFTAEDRADVERVAAIIGEGYVAARDHGALLVVVFIPTSFRVHREVVRCAEPSACAEREVNDFPTKLQGLLADRIPGVHYVDLTPDLIEHARRGKVTYRPDDMHWDPLGHRIAAEMIASELRRLGVLSPAVPSAGG